MSELLAALSVVFVAAGVFLLVANQLRLPSVPFLILAGLVAGLFIDEEVTLDLAQYGIAFLVFTFGARLDFSTVENVLRDGEVAALSQFVVTGGLGLGAGILLGFDVRSAVYLGVATALSSTIIGTGLLQPEIRENLVHGRLAEAIHFVQDVFAIVLLLMLSTEVFTVDAVALKLGYGVMLFAAAIVINRYVYDLMSRFAEGSDELLLVGSIAVLVGFLAAAELLGVSIAVGAFAAGLAITRDTSQNLGVLNGLESIKDFFVAVFFVTLGALVTIPQDVTLLTTGVLILLTAVVKPAVTTAVLLFEGYEARSATLASLSLDQVSEFALIIAIQAFLVGTLSQGLFEAIILAAAVTMITSSLTRRNDERIYRLLDRTGLLPDQHEQTDAQSSVPDDLTDHVVIVGYGRQGRRLVAACETTDAPYVVIENDPSMLDPLSDSCEAYVFGDAMESYPWSKASVTDARLVVSTVDQGRVSEHILSLDTDADIVLRAATATEATELLDAGATYVNVPDLLASDRLVEHVEALATGETTPEGLRRRHLDELDDLRATGFDSMREII